MSKSSNLNATSPAASIFYRCLGLCLVLLLAIETTDRVDQLLLAIKTTDRIDQRNAFYIATWVCMATGFMIAAGWPLLKGTNAPVTGKLRIVAFGLLIMAVVLLFLRMTLK